MKNKKPAVKGTCGTCGTAMFAMGLTIPKIREKNATWKAAAASGGQVEGQAPALAPSATSG